MWHEVERLFNANDPISPDSRDALARTRVRFRGGGLDAAFKGARSPDREREELDDCEPVVWDKQSHHHDLRRKPPPETKFSVG